MKKLFALLLALAMMLSLVACNNEPETTTAPSDTTVTTAPDATTVPVTTAPVVVRENKLVYATTARFDGDFAAGLFLGGVRDVLGGNAAASFDDRTLDRVIGDLLTDYGTLALQRDGTYAYNMTVLAKEPVVTDNPNGTRTYTLQIKNNLTYNTGKAITARDYIFRMLFVNSAACPALDGRGHDGSDYPNGGAFYHGQTPAFSDIRLIDDYTWTVTVSTEKAGHVFASDAVAATPWDAEYWFGAGYAVADDGNGCYLSKDGQAVTMDLALAAQVSANFKAVRSGKVLPAVTAGPYQLTGYDETTGLVTLEKNPNYLGNFEGQIPAIETLEIRSVGEDAWQKDFEKGDIHLVDTLKHSGDINAVAELVDEGAAFAIDEFDRAGYGKLQFALDATPTQFVEVRQALACLIDRQAVVDLYCQGRGSVVSGPYSNAFWMARESEAFFGQNLDAYKYNVKTAEKLLEQGGWIYDEYGNLWEEGDGLRYKEVSRSEADYMDECDDWGDTYMMPLVIKWAASEDNMVTDLLKVLLIQSEDVANLGMEIRVDEMDFTDMLSYMYRQDLYGAGDKDLDEPYEEPYYSMFNLATGWESAQYDESGKWAEEEELSQLAHDMVYGVAEGDRAGYLAAWQAYVDCYNQLLPELPLYVDQYATVYSADILGYDQDTFWGFQNAVLYASIAE